MRFEGQLIKAGKFWAVEIPMLHVHTQGRTKKEAYEMAKDAIEELVEKAGFEVTVFPGKGDSFTVESNQPAVFIAFMLRQLRTFSGLTTREVASRLGSSSPNAYAQYEQGKRQPSLEVLVKLLQAIDPGFQPVLSDDRDKKAAG